MEQDSASAFAGVQEVYLDETLLRPPQVWFLQRVQSSAHQGPSSLQKC
jgi:hypothetical protein